MAHNKEAMIIVLDVSEDSGQIADGSTETFLEKEKQCCMKLLQKKMFAAKKDEVTLVFMGTEETVNRQHDSHGNYLNICEFGDLDVPNWDLVAAVNRCRSVRGTKANWLDALDVAIEVINCELKTKKFGIIKIVLFTKFASTVDSFSNKKTVVDTLKALGIELVVISDNIEFCFNEAGDEAPSQATFTQKPNKTDQQIAAEQAILEVIEEADGNLTNFDCVIEHLTYFQRKKTRPWFWYATMEIGKDLQMEIAATILVKRENPFKFVNVPKETNSVLRTETEYYKNGEKIDVNPEEEMIKSYMIGSTPIAYDETLGVTRSNTSKGIRCLAFTKRSSIQPEYLCGNGTYIVMARDGCGRSQKLFRLLVKAMVNTDCAMIASRVFLNNKNPKLIALFPNIDTDIPTFSLFELVYADQVHHWYFPQLCTKKTEPTAEQYEAIDELIDSMDLINAGENNEEAFALEKLNCPVIQNIYENITNRALNPEFKVKPFDGRLEQALQMPSILLERSAEALKNIERLFPIEEIKVSNKKEFIRKICQIPIESGGMDTLPIVSDEDKESKAVIEVGTVTPEEDFKTLLNRDVNSFPKVSEQLGNVLYDLIFKSITDQSVKVCDAMMTFRQCGKFYGPYVYNEWIRRVKDTVIVRKKHDFWENVVVKNSLGIISLSESEQAVSVTDAEAEEFYKINVGRQLLESNRDGDDADVDDLFGQM